MTVWENINGFLDQRSKAIEQRLAKQSLGKLFVIAFISAIAIVAIVGAIVGIADQFGFIGYVLACMIIAVLYTTILRLLA